MILPGRQQLLSAKPGNFQSKPWIAGSCSQRASQEAWEGAGLSKSWLCVEIRPDRGRVCLNMSDFSCGSVPDRRRLLQGMIFNFKAAEPNQGSWADALPSPLTRSRLHGAIFGFHEIASAIVFLRSQGCYVWRARWMIHLTIICAQTVFAQLYLTAAVPLFLKWQVKLATCSVRAREL